MSDPPDSSPRPVAPIVPAYSTSEASWVPLGHFSPLEAQLAQARLQGEGIPCSIAQENTAALGIDSLGYARLQVLAHDLERARAILNAVSDARAARAHADRDAAMRCPYCGKNNVELIPFSRPLFLISLLLLGFPLLLANRRRRCRDCGADWPA